MFNRKIVNIYHCCVQKTGSQWIKAILSDELVLKKTGMTIYTYHRHMPGGENRKLTERIFAEPFPENCILTPLYMDYKSYLTIPKPSAYSTFCIIRDPRDIIISWYFSVKYSHPLMGKIPQHREILANVSLAEGLIYSIEYLQQYGLFAAQQSWVNAAAQNSHIKLFRFEDLIDSDRQFASLTGLFAHCRFRFTGSEIEHLMGKYCFAEMQKKSQNNQPHQPEDRVISHYRKGAPGDWQNYFNEEVNAAFKKQLGNMVNELGYRE